MTLNELGETLAALTRHTMDFGYSRPIRRTGALIGDVTYTARESPHTCQITIGSRLDYGRYVHPSRPYLRDTLASPEARRAAREFLCSNAAERTEKEYGWKCTITP